MCSCESKTTFSPLRTKTERRRESAGIIAARACPCVTLPRARGPQHIITVIMCRACKNSPSRVPPLRRGGFYARAESVSLGGRVKSPPLRLGSPRLERTVSHSHAGHPAPRTTHPLPRASSFVRSFVPPPPATSRRSLRTVQSPIRQLTHDVRPTRTASSSTTITVHGRTG